MAVYISVIEIIIPYCAGADIARENGAYWRVVLIANKDTPVNMQPPAAKDFNAVFPGPADINVLLTQFGN